MPSREPLSQCGERGGEVREHVVKATQMRATALRPDIRPAAPGSLMLLRISTTALSYRTPSRTEEVDQVDVVDVFLINT